MGERIVIAGMGAATAVGRGAWESATAVRAGISGFTQHPYMIDTAGEPMRVALAPWLDIALQGVERFEALLMPAVEEALASLGPPQTAPRRWGGHWRGCIVRHRPGPRSTPSGAGRSALGRRKSRPSTSL